MSYSSSGRGFSIVPIYLAAISESMSRNKNQITSAEEFAPFKVFFQSRQEEGHVDIYISVSMPVTYYHPLNRWTDFLEF
jgi:hypothetical protein